MIFRSSLRNLVRTTVEPKSPCKEVERTPALNKIVHFTKNAQKNTCSAPSVAEARNPYERCTPLVKISCYVYAPHRSCVPSTAYITVITERRPFSLRTYTATTYLSANLSSRVGCHPTCRPRWCPNAPAPLSDGQDRSSTPLLPAGIAIAEAKASAFCSSWVVCARPESAKKRTTFRKSHVDHCYLSETDRAVHHRREPWFLELLSPCRGCIPRDSRQAWADIRKGGREWGQTILRVAGQPHFCTEPRRLGIYHQLRQENQADDEKSGVVQGGAGRWGWNGDRACYSLRH